MYTVEKMLNHPSFRDFEVLAGKAGLLREITTVTVMDAPDIDEWMKGGEFLITTAYIFREDPMEMEELIVRLEKSGASAFGIKLNRFIETIPDSVLRTADALSFPIISIPIRFAFTDVINPVLEELVNSQYRKLEHTQEIHNTFIELALSGAPISKILSRLEDLIARKAALLDMKNGKRYGSDGTCSDLQTDPPLDPGKQYYHLHVQEEEYGYIEIGERERREKPEDDPDEYHQIVVEQAGLILILKIQEFLAASQVEAKYREQFVQDLIFNNIKSPEEIFERTKLYHWDLKDGGRVFIVDVDDFKQQYMEKLDIDRNQKMDQLMNNIMRTSALMLKSAGYAVSYCCLSDQVIFILRGQVDDASLQRFRSTLDDLKGQIRYETNFTVTIGVGDYRNDVSKIYESYREARNAVIIARNIFHRNQVAFYSEMGLLRLLSGIGGTSEALEYEESNLGALEQYDREHHTDYVKTLETLIDCDWNLKEAAEHLFVHYNSIKHRYRKLCEITGKDLKKADCRLEMEIALKLRQMKIVPPV